MAFDPTVLQEAIVNTQDMMGFGAKENETRASKYGALEAYAFGTSRSIPASELRRIKEATAQVSSIDVFVREGVTPDNPGVTDARACEGAGTGTTLNQDLVYQTFSEQFALSEIEHHGNRTKYQEAFNHMFQQRMQSLWARIDSAAVAHLEANKATGGGAGTIYANDVTDPDAQAVPLASESNFLNDVYVEMAENDFYNGPYVNVASTRQRALHRFDAQQGSANAENLAFMQADFMHMTTNRLAAGVGNNSTSYIFDPSAVGMVSWTNLLSRNGKDIGTDVWSVFADPAGLLGDIELKIKKGCADNSVSFAGAEADYVESFVMTIEIAFVAAYDSVHGAPIYKYVLKDA